MGNMRKEIKNAVMLFALFQVVNFISILTGNEIQVLHFCLGIIAALAFMELIIGLLSDSIYHKVRNFKRNRIPFSR